MNLRRLLPLTSPLVLIGLGAAPARADLLYSFTAFGTTATTPLIPVAPEPSSGLLFFAGVGAVAGALALRRRAHMQGKLPG